ncbi:MAG: DegQ family serine endoprotease [Verrucomicrobia bacterium]|nr:DegQ family serine endoprotease [Verrucomicrobiota bacterium]
MNSISQSRFTMRTAVLSALSVLIALQAAPLAKASSGAAKTNAAPRLSIQETPISRDLRAATSVAPVVKKVAPSVVNIYSTVTVREQPNPLRRFFGEQFGGQAEPRTRKEQGLGSGVIVSSDGYILTASHVVDGADKVKVGLASGEKEFDAKIVGTDPATDTAVLKVDGKNLPAVTLADSDKLEVGDVVLAIGNPFGVGQTVTMGIISALGRGGFGINNYENFIQTDAAINLGNSGGPLVDAEGRLVGINTWIISRTGGSQGLGFAVPINMARYAMERLISDGKVTRGYLGLILQPDMTLELAKQFNLPNMNGALVTTVEPDSPAGKAGVKEADFITEFNGQKIKDMRQFRLLVSQTTPGKKVTLKVLREGKEKTLTATLGEMPKEGLARSGQGQPGERGESKTDALEGVEVTDLDAQARREADVPSSIRGVLVANVDQNSNAADAGLRPGDVITEINRQPVRTAEEAVASSEKAKGDRILLRVWRGGEGRSGMLYLSVDNTKRK